MSITPLTAQQIQASHQYVQQKITDVLNALTQINDPQASAKYTSTYINNLNTLIQNSIQQALGMALWLASKQNIAITQYTDTQALATGITSPPKVIL